VSESIPVKLAVQQRVLPSYRVPFFDALAGVCEQGLSIFAGLPLKDEALDTGAVLMKANFFKAKNVHLFSGGLYSCWQVNICRWLQSWQPQVLIMEANPRYPCSWFAIRWMHAHAGKVIGWGLGSPQPKGQCGPARLFWRKKFISKFDALITYSQFGMREYAALGFPEQRIFKAPNAVAPKPTHLLVERPTKFRGEQPIILFVGRLQERKRIDQLIRACALLQTTHRPALWIVGDGPMRAQLESLAREIYPSAKFYGAQHGNDLEMLFRSADLFVLPGTGGLAVQQAMSFGLPVIVGEADGTQSDLVRSENGWVLENSTPQNLSKAIQWALEDIHLLRKMGAASYQIVSEEVNLERMVKVFTEVVHCVLES